MSGRLPWLASMEWHERAACRTADPALFFGTEGSGNASGTNTDDEKAKGYCRRCPVREECLAHALARPERYGLWGGYSESELKRMRRRRELVAKYANREPAA